MQPAALPPSCAPEQPETKNSVLEDQDDQILSFVKKYELLETYIASPVLWSFQAVSSLPRQEVPKIDC